jgi:hypothetical protein
LVMNIAGRFMSAPAVLSLIPIPTLLGAPATQTAEAGSDVQFLARAVEGAPLNYQWFFNNSLVPGATDCYLRLTQVGPSNTGAYTVVVSNACGCITSSPAWLATVPPIERKLVPGLVVFGTAGNTLTLEQSRALGPAADWSGLDTIELTNTSQWYFDLFTTQSPQRFYRTYQPGPSEAPSMSCHMVPAITLTGAIGSSVRLDAVNQFGPTDAWAPVATVTLTNSSQVYFDVSAVGQPPRLWRVVRVP